MQKRVLIAAVIAAALATGWRAGIEAQQAAAPSWNSTYTDAQATRGSALYAGNCVACHGKDLAGSERGPALAGPAFAARWGSRPLADLLEYVHTQMPLHSPGGLSRQQSADILAFVLQRGGAKPGASELSGGPAAAAPAADAGRAKTPAASGFYTKEQAFRGRTAFNRNCAFCHTVDAKLWDAENNTTILPRTFGGHFVERVYHDHRLYPTVYHLYRKMESMPAFDTLSITPQTRADILAYILENNGLKPGPSELTPDTGLMKTMRLGEQGFESLFNGRDFSGIHFVIGPNCTAAPDGCGRSEPGPIVRVENGEIRCVCNVHGYFYWDTPYKDFTFRFEQKFDRPSDWDPADPLFFGGTGALIFIQPPHRVFPRSVEIEGRYYDLGEPFAIQGKAKITYDHKARLRAGRPVGEWDEVEIASKNGTVQTFVNGTLVSTFSEHDYPAGQLGMQLEGAPVSWRNLRVKPE